MGTICEVPEQMVPIEISQTPPPLLEDLASHPRLRGGGNTPTALREASGFWILSSLVSSG